MAVSALAAASGAPNPRSPARDSQAGVSGAAIVTIAGSGTAEKDASGVVIWLVPLEAMQPVRVAAQRPHYRLVQRNKKFEPGLLVVPVGSVVDCPNADPWFHNVFSLYRGKRFDLGLYQAGAQRSVRFDRIGPSYLFCNIHPEMSGAVVSVDTPYFGISDRSGRVTLPNVPDGRYQLNVWYERSLPEDLKAAGRTVTISDATRSLESIHVVENPNFTVEHKNKYGQDYVPPANPSPAYNRP